MNLSLYEQETILNYNEVETTASVYTNNRTLIRKLDKLAQERPGDCHREKTSHDGKSVDFVIPKAWIKINPPRKLTPEQRELRREIAKRTILAKQTGQ